MSLSPLPSLHGRVWAILPSYFRAMSHVMEFRKIDADMLSQAAADVAEKRRNTRQAATAVAVIPVLGPLDHRPTVLGELCGFSNTMELGMLFDAAIADPNVKSILLDIDSPGGVAHGVMELADKIYRGRNEKPVVAVANSMAASAAFWIGSAASRLYSTPSGSVGSVGVFSIHEDYSQQLAEDGVKMTIIKAGKYKAETNPFEPLSTDAHDYEQGQVDEIYGEFLSGLARNRGTDVSTVRKTYGEGRVLGAKAALAAGMIDRISTAEDVYSRLKEGRIRIGGPAANDDWDSPIQLITGPDVELLRRRIKLRERSA